MLSQSLADLILGHHVRIVPTTVVMVMVVVMVGLRMRMETSRLAVVFHGVVNDSGNIGDSDRDEQRKKQEEETKEDRVEVNPGFDGAEQRYADC